jgi:hypothetical protein
VDEEMLRRVRGWLLAKRDGNGGFRREAEGHYGFGLCDREIADGYLVYALVKSGERDLTLEATATHAYALQAKDSYLLALSALTHFELGKHAEAAKALNQLLTLQRENGSWQGKTHSITRSGGLALELETTALALQAVLASGQPDNGVLRKGTTSCRHTVGTAAASGLRKVLYLLWRRSRRMPVTPDKRLRPVPLPSW